MYALRMSKDGYRKTSMFPKTLAQCIEPVARPALKAQGLAGSRIITQWPSIVGTKLAMHCAPEKLSFPVGKRSNGTLVISVENGFAPDIQHQQPLILQRLSSYFGYQAVSRIVISHTYIPAIQKKAAKPAAKKNTPHTAIEFNSADIKDDELRKTLESFAKTLSTPST